LTRLLADENEEWNAANRGRPITRYWLRDNLRGLLTPEAAQDWEIGSRNNRQHCSGYYRSQIEATWATHLTRRSQSGNIRPEHYIPFNPLSASGGSGGSGGIAEFPGTQSAEKPRNPPDASGGHAETVENLENAPAPSGGNAGSREKLHNLEAAPESSDGSCDTYPIDGSLADSTSSPDSPDPPDLGKRKGVGIESAFGNGLGPAATGPRTGRRKSSQLAEMIRAQAAAHPEWSHENLAKRLGQPRNVVERALKGYTPSPGDAS
jgi:hypothetical protein